MMQLIIGLVTGLIFGIGLIIGGMTNPLKVQNFLDLTGRWDPSLAFVMGGAIVVALPLFRLLSQRQKPWLADQFYWPTRQDIDGRLIAGAGLFGIGWGLGGLCPGPAFTVLSTAGPLIGAFVAAMIAGMALAKWFARE